MMDDPLLMKYSIIMVDEAHERSLPTDMLMGLLKTIQRRRPELRLIISSATIEAKSMSDFFHMKKKQERDMETLVPKTQPAILSVEGKGFPVEIQYLEEPTSDYLQAAVTTVQSIHEEEPVGDLLVFLTGQDEIDAAVKLLADYVQDNRRRVFGLLILPLYSGLSRADQELVFAPTPRGKRKVILSTNIAETYTAMNKVWS